VAGAWLPACATSSVSGAASGVSLSCGVSAGDSALAVPFIVSKSQYSRTLVQLNRMSIDNPLNTTSAFTTPFFTAFPYFLMEKSTINFVAGVSRTTKSDTVTAISKAVFCVKFTFTPTET
jgi:hypothetical protein